MSEYSLRRNVCDPPLSWASYTEWQTATAPHFPLHTRSLSSSPGSGSSAPLLSTPKDWPTVDDFFHNHDTIALPSINPPSVVKVEPLESAAPTTDNFIIENPTHDSSYLLSTSSSKSKSRSKAKAKTKSKPRSKHKSRSQIKSKPRRKRQSQRHSSDPDDNDDDDDVGISDIDIDVDNGELLSEEDDDDEPSIQTKLESFVSSQALAPPTEVPLRATQAPKKMKSMMGVFRINPFAMHSGVSGSSSMSGDGDDSGGGSGGKAMVTMPGLCWEPGPLEEEPVMFEFQLDLIGDGEDEDVGDSAGDSGGRRRKSDGFIDSDQVVLGFPTPTTATDGEESSFAYVGEGSTYHRDDAKFSLHTFSPDFDLHDDFASTPSSVHAHAHVRRYTSTPISVCPEDQGGPLVLSITSSSVRGASSSEGKASNTALLPVEQMIAGSTAAATTGRSVQDKATIVLDEPSSTCPSQPQDSHSGSGPTVGFEPVYPHPHHSVHQHPHPHPVSQQHHLEPSPPDAGYICSSTSTSRVASWVAIPEQEILTQSADSLTQGVYDYHATGRVSPPSEETGTSREQQEYSVDAYAGISVQGDASQERGRGQGATGGSPGPFVTTSMVPAPAATVFTPLDSRHHFHSHHHQQQQQQHVHTTQAGGTIGVNGLGLYSSPGPEVVPQFEHAQTSSSADVVPLATAVTMTMAGDTTQSVVGCATHDTVRVARATDGIVGPPTPPIPSSASSTSSSTSASSSSASSFTSLSSVAEVVENEQCSFTARRCLGAGGSYSSTGYYMPQQHQQPQRRRLGPVSQRQAQGQAYRVFSDRYHGHHPYLRPVHQQPPAPPAALALPMTTVQAQETSVPSTAQSHLVPAPPTSSLPLPPSHPPSSISTSASGYITRIPAPSHASHTQARPPHPHYESTAATVQGNSSSGYYSASAPYEYEYEYEYEYDHPELGSTPSPRWSTASQFSAPGGGSGCGGGLVGGSVN